MSDSIRNKSCALSGHRELSSTFDKQALYDKLESLILEGYDYFLCGMARGFDFVALEQLVLLRQRYKFQMEACIPYRDHFTKFSLDFCEKYNKLLSWCDRRTYVQEEFSKRCFLKRNEYMVDRADLLLSYCTRSVGGTAYTVRYAKSKQIPVIFINSPGI